MFGLKSKSDMCNVQSPNTRALIVEVLENGKVSLPPFIHPIEAQLSLDELKKCRDYLDLIISNPGNFHVVRPEIEAVIAAAPYCNECGKSLSCQTQTERDNKLCFDCEKQNILRQVNPPFDEAKFMAKVGEVTAPFVDAMNSVEIGPMDMNINSLRNKELCLRVDCIRKIVPGSLYCIVHKKDDN